MTRIKLCFSHFLRYGLCGCLALAAVCFSPLLCTAQTPDNQVSMVTYFPVPYAAYNNLYVSQKLDIGLRKDGTFELELNGNPALQAQEAILQQVSGSGKFSLDMPVLVSEKAYFGQLSADTATLTFNKNLYIGGIENNNYKTTGHTPVNEVSSPQKIRVVGDVYLFGNNNNAKLPNTCEETISWQSLKDKNNNSHEFLVCGGNSEPENADYGFVDDDNLYVATERVDECADSNTYYVIQELTEQPLSVFHPCKSGCSITGAGAGSWCERIGVVPEDSLRCSNQNNNCTSAADVGNTCVKDTTSCVKGEAFEGVETNLCTVLVKTYWPQKKCVKLN